MLVPLVYQRSCRDLLHNGMRGVRLKVASDGANTGSKRGWRELICGSQTASL